MALSMASRGASVAAVAVAALVFGAPAAFAQAPSLSIATYSPATLLARGAAAQVRVVLTCDAADTNVNVTVTERVGNRISTAFGSTHVTCTGSAQQAVVNVAAANAPLERGTAFVDSEIFGCNGDECAGARDQRVIGVGR